MAPSESKVLPPIKVGAVSILHLATKKDDRFNRHRLIQSPLYFLFCCNYYTGMAPMVNKTRS